MGAKFMKRLNVGCGTDYREGYINIDGSNELPHVDKIIDLSQERLSRYYDENSIDEIIAQGFIEHHFHWEAINILNDFHFILNENGILYLQLPDAEWIMKTRLISIDRKINLLFGGQDIPQGNEIQDKSRLRYPQYFCHKYGWSKNSLSETLKKIGFNIEKIKTGNLFDTNMYFWCKKIFKIGGA